MLRRLLLPLTPLVAVLVLGTTLAPAYADGSAYAPLHRKGPTLAVPKAALRAALSCRGNPHKGPEPVLLNPATSVTPEQNYSWNYEKAFSTQGRYWCAVTMPQHTFGDIQTAAEYLVFAIRRMRARTGRWIAILGHSQGGMSMRWALRFWPKTRPMVDDVIGMAGDNHGTTALAGCLPGVTTCTPAVWQQLRGSAFITALNSRAETFAHVSYTEIFTHTDEVVTPSSTTATASSALHTGAGRITNVATQDVCPTDAYEHVMTGTVSPTTYALVMDALDHPGPTVPSRVPRSVCGQLYMPGIDPVSLATYLPVLGALPSLASTELPLVTLSGAPMLKAEPPLRCYVFRRGC